MRTRRENGRGSESKLKYPCVMRAAADFSSLISDMRCERGLAIGHEGEATARDGLGMDSSQGVSKGRQSRRQPGCEKGARRAACQASFRAAAAAADALHSSSFLTLDPCRDLRLGFPFVARRSFQYCTTTRFHKHAYIHVLFLLPQRLATGLWNTCPKGNQENVTGSAAHFFSNC